MFDFLRIRQTIADVGAELKKLRAEREALLQRREDLESAPLDRLDQLALIDAWIDRKGADFPSRLRTGVAYYSRHPLSVLPENPKQAAQPLAVLTATGSPDAAATLSTLEASLCFVLADELKQGARRAADSWDFTDAGPPRVERVEEIAKIDKRIAELDKQEMSLVEEAEKAGLRL